MSPWSSIKGPLVTVLFIFIFFYVFTRLFGPIPLSINSVTTTKTDLFTVDGTGEATAVPDTARFSIGVTKTASTVQDAQNQVNQIVNAVTQELKQLGVEEKNIKTTNYSVNPEYDYSQGRQTARGYNVTQNIDIEVKPIEKANQALDIATGKGANQVGGITFTLDDEAKEKLEEKARGQAIEKAKKKAQTISNLAGIRLGRIINVNESPSSYPIPLYEGRSLATDQVQKAEPPTELQPGENTIRVTVNISYETL
ncbi:MAG: SIMPL domain-containing protein [Candidatus Levybacteria bacterium]|nr:SIMPL domain-containing protein [Candidatus Levybacteria bacterium]